MAAKEQQQDLDLDIEKPGKSKTNLLIIILIVVIVAVGGGVAALFLLPGNDKADAKGNLEGKDAAVAAPTALYLALYQPFIINFEDTSKARYVQVEMTLMARTQHALDLATEHSPVIRNNFIIILSSQKYTELNTPEGKQKLNRELLKSINDTIGAEVANSPAKDKEGDKEPQPEPAVAPADAGHGYIEAIYFTSFVMQ